MREPMQQETPDALMPDVANPINERHTPFLEQVALKAELPDIFDAKDLTTIVYRTMRDLMTTEASAAVEAELHVKADENADNKRLQDDVAELWHDDNPLVAWLSKVRPPLKFDADTFMFRIEKEGGMPSGTNSKKVISAVFAATKEELSKERIQEIANFLPGEIKDMWEAA